MFCKCAVVLLSLYCSAILLTIEIMQIDTKMPYKKMLENSNIRYTKDQIFKQKIRTKEIERKRHEKRKKRRTTQEKGRKWHEKRKNRRKALRPGGGGGAVAKPVINLYY